MAQRTFACTSCGNAIEVPDNYFRAQIACSACGTAHQRLTGQAAQAGPAPGPGYGQPTAPGAAAPYPRSQGVPYPQQMPPGAAYPRSQGVPYPQAMAPGYAPQFAYGPPPKSGSKGWIIALVLGGGGLFFLILILAAIPLLMEGSTGSVDSWYEYRSERGGFSAKFPSRPLESTKSESTGLGMRTMYRAVCVSGGASYEVTYFDLGDGPMEDYEFDATVGFAGMADLCKGRVLSNQSTTHKGRAADKGVIENDSGYRCEALIMRVGNRVYLVGCESAKGKSAMRFDEFVGTFTLLGDSGGGVPADPFASYKKQGLMWMTKSTTKTMGMDPIVNYMRFEITKVADDHAIQTTWMLDKDKKPMAGTEKGIESKIEFKKVGNPVRNAPATKKQKVKCAAGEFDCISYDDGKSWMMEKYPIIAVKGDWGQSEMELIEFKE